MTYNMPAYKHPATFEQVREAMSTIGFYVYDTGHFRRFTDEEADLVQEKAREAWEASGREGYWNDHVTSDMAITAVCSLENPESCEACT